MPNWLKLSCKHIKISSRMLALLLTKICDMWNFAHILCLSSSSQFHEGHVTASHDRGQFLSLWCLGGLQTQSGLTTFPTAVWGMDCGPEGMCEAQH